MLSHDRPSQKPGSLLIPRISRSTKGGGAFSLHILILWSYFQVTVPKIDTFSLFKSRFKAFHFVKTLLRGGQFSRAAAVVLPDTYCLHRTGDKPGFIDSKYPGFS